MGGGVPVLSLLGAVKPVNHLIVGRHDERTATGPPTPCPDTRVRKKKVFPSIDLRLQRDGRSENGGWSTYALIAGRRIVREAVTFVEHAGQGLERFLDPIARHGARHLHHRLCRQNGKKKTFLSNRPMNRNRGTEAEKGEWSHPAGRGPAQSVVHGHLRKGVGQRLASSSCHRFDF